MTCRESGKDSFQNEQAAVTNVGGDDTGLELLDLIHTRNKRRGECTESTTDELY